MQVPRAQTGVPVVTRRTIDLAHDLGIQVHVWVVDDPADMTRLLDMGVDGLITDAPTTLRAVLNGRSSTL
jgi:glycerophosphoryl diester phosphodiesterase